MLASVPKIRMRSSAGPEEGIVPGRHLYRVKFACIQSEELMLQVIVG